MLPILFYILAGIVLGIGLSGGIVLITGASSLAANSILPLQLAGGGAIANMISPVVSSFLVNLGIILILVGVVVSFLLFGIGRLMNRVVLLETRLSVMEKTQQLVRSTP